MERYKYYELYGRQAFDDVVSLCTTSYINAWTVINLCQWLKFLKNNGCILLSYHPMHMAIG